MRLRHSPLAVAALVLAACADRVPADPLASYVSSRASAATHSVAPARYIVVYKKSSAAGSPAGLRVLAERAVAAGQFRIVERMRFRPNTFVVRNVQNLAALRADPNVQTVIPDLLMDLTTASVAAAPSVVQTGARFYRLGWQWDMRQMGVDQTTSFGEGAKVCITDTGVDQTHQDLAGKVDGTLSFIPNDEADTLSNYTLKGYASAVDSNGHGSHVSGTVSTNGIGTMSVAPRARLYMAKIFNAKGGGAYTSRVLGAVDWCSAPVDSGGVGADVINMSIGFTGGIPVTGIDSTSVPGEKIPYDNSDFIQYYMDGLAVAAERGTLVVVSAGNDNAQQYTDWRAANRIFLPAQAPTVLSVGSSANPTGTSLPFGTTWPQTRFDGRATYSDFGDPVMIWAPGGQYAGTNPSANEVTSVCASAAVGACAGGRGYQGLQGTSMASPHVAGLAAVVRSRPDFVGLPRSRALRDRIAACLINTGDPVPATTANTTDGSTRPRANAVRAATDPNC